MIGKICKAPGNSSARSAVRYILGYALSDGLDAEKSRENYHSLMEVAALRSDFGVGQLWKPTVGDGKRPSAIYVSGVTSLATADIEMSGTASANPRVKDAVMHMVFSLSPKVERTDEEFVAGIRETLDRLGVSHFQHAVVIHRDCDHIHAHVALGTVDPQTYKALDRTWLYERVDKAMRETEVARGWEHDHGLVVVRDAGQASQRIEKSTAKERKLWAEERGAGYDRQRADELEKRRFQVYENLEKTFDRYVKATVVPRLRQIVDRSRELGESPTWTEIHKKASEFGVRIEESQDLADSLPSYDRLVLREVRRDKDGSRIEGEAGLVRLADVVDSREWRGLDEYRSMEEAEQDFTHEVESDPSLITKNITQETSTFDRDDLVRYVSDRISDVGEVERLVDLVIAKDDTLQIVGVDGPLHIYSTKEMVSVESKLAEHARVLAARNVAFDPIAFDKAILEVEKDLGKGAKLSNEQRQMVSHFDRGLSVAEGDPGTGKSVSMRVAQKYSKLMGKEIVALTTSQAAAMRLQSETGIKTYNTAKGALLEELGDQVVPTGGTLIIEEAAMVNSASTERLLNLARSRSCSVICIGDTKQLQPIEAGQSMRITREAARDAGTFTTLIGIQRQRNVWHREAVSTIADGLRAVETTGKVDAAKISEAIESLEKNDVFEEHDDLASMIGAAARDYCIDRAAGVEAVYMAASNETRRYANEAIRERLGLAGTGVEIETQFGPREIATGDLLVLRQNDSKLGVVNGDRVTVDRVDESGRIHAIKADGKKLVIPRRYDAVDHGYVISYHASQGASVERGVLLLDKAASAELFFVGLSRSKGSVKALYHRGSFENVEEIAEHVASRSTLKTTSRTFSEREERDRKTSVLPSSEIHPLRPAYEKIEAAKRERRDEAMRALHEKYAVIRKDMGIDGTLAERLTKSKDIEKQRRRDAAKIVKDFAPVQFGRFCSDEKARESEVKKIQQEQTKTKDRDIRSVRSKERSRVVDLDHGYSR